MSNLDVLDAVGQHSRSVFHGDLARTQRGILGLLELTGATTRHWATEASERDLAIDECLERALAEANLATEEIDLVLFAGVDRRVLEPGEAHLIAARIGAVRAQCFDITDACASWIRAVQLAEVMMTNGDIRHAVIVTAEFHGADNSPVKRATFRLRSRGELSWRFPSFTIGDCATATVLDGGGPRWRWETIHQPHLASLCTIRSEPTRTDGLEADAWAFISHGAELHRCGRPHLLQTLSALIHAHGLDDCTLVPHTTHVDFWTDAAADAGFRGTLHQIYPRRGNVVSSSLPAGLASLRARAHRDSTVLWMGAAGMSFWAVAASW